MIKRLGIIDEIQTLLYCQKMIGLQLKSLFYTLSMLVILVRVVRRNLFNKIRFLPHPFFVCKCNS